MRSSLFKIKLQIICIITLCFSCNNEEKNTKEEYLGNWESAKGETTIQVYEQNNNMFIKWLKKGETVPLKYNEEGKYYEASTAFGSMPVIIANDTLVYSQTKYIRSENSN